jgi:hypothetical protein
MLTKETHTVEVESYFFKGEGPYHSGQSALETYLVEKHMRRDQMRLDFDSLFADKEFLITLGDWAKEETKNAN